MITNNDHNWVLSVFFSCNKNLEVLYTKYTLKRSILKFALTKDFYAKEILEDHLKTHQYFNFSIATFLLFRHQPSVI